MCNIYFEPFVKIIAYYYCLGNNVKSSHGTRSYSILMYTTPFVHLKPGLIPLKSPQQLFSELAVKSFLCMRHCWPSAMQIDSQRGDG